MGWYNPNGRNQAKYLIVLVGCAGLVFALLPSLTGTYFHPFCFFRTLTGYPCPACGSTHAAELLLKGDFTGAFLMNPLVYITGAIFLLSAILIGIDFSTGSDLFNKNLDRLRNYFTRKSWSVYLIVFLFGANWVWNFIKFS